VYVPGTYSVFYLLDRQDIQSGVKVEDIQLVGEETITDASFFPDTEITLKGQAALPKLDSGLHNLTVFVGWIREDGAIFHANIEPFSTTAYFSVDSAAATTSPSPSSQETETAPKPLPTTFVAVSLVSIAVANMSLLIYFKKRNHRWHL